MVLRLNKMPDSAYGRADSLATEIPPLFVEEQSRYGYIASVQRTVQGVPAALQVLYVDIDRRVVEEGFDELDGIFRSRRGGTEEDCQTHMIPCIHIVLPECWTAVLSTAVTRAPARCLARLGHGLRRGSECAGTSTPSTTSAAVIPARGRVRIVAGRGEQSAELVHVAIVEMLEQ